MLSHFPLSISDRDVDAGPEAEGGKDRLVTALGTLEVPTTMGQRHLEKN